MRSPLDRFRGTGEQDGSVDLPAMLPALVALHVVVIAAVVLVLARVLPQHFQRRPRD